MQSLTIYEDNSSESIEQLVLQHRKLVKKIAVYIKRRLPSHIELDDLIQSGLIGLLEARKNYKPDMNASFETYASIRIRGAILDDLRKNSWVGRDTIKTMKQISQVIHLIEQRDQKQATTEDIVKELGISLSDYYKVTQEINLIHITSLNENDSLESMLGSDANNPENLLQQDSLKERLKLVLNNLPEKEKLVLSLYYVDELTFKQIGEVLELTEARICQLHGQAIARVRAKMSSKEYYE